MRIRMLRRTTRALLNVYRYPLTVLCAPTGYGKTAVTGNFLSRRRGTADELPVTVLDDADRLAAAPPELAGLLAGSPGAGEPAKPRVACDMAHVLLLCREVPAWLPRELLLSPDCLYLGPEALAFTRDELDGLLREDASSARAAFADEVWANTHGWPVLAAFCIGEGRISPRCLDFLRRQVFPALNGPERELLAALAEAGPATSDRAAQLAPKAALLLPGLLAKGLCVFEDGAYSVHPMARRVLCPGWEPECARAGGPAGDALEQEVLRLYADGCTQLEISARLQIPRAQTRRAIDDFYHRHGVEHKLELSRLLRAQSAV